MRGLDLDGGVADAEIVFQFVRQFSQEAVSGVPGGNDQVRGEIGRAHV